MSSHKLTLHVLRPHSELPPFSVSVACEIAATFEAHAIPPNLSYLEPMGCFSLVCDDDKLPLDALDLAHSVARSLEHTFAEFKSKRHPST